MISGEIFDFVYQRISGRQYYSCCLFSDSTQISLMKVSMGTITSQMIMLHEIIFQGRWTGGIRRGLVVKMLVAPSESSQVRVFSGSPWVGSPGRYIDVRHCGRLSMTLMQLWEPLELFWKEREFLPGSLFLSRRIMACLSDQNTHSFLSEYALNDRRPLPIF